MILEKVADVIVGQIMTRVSAEGKDGVKVVDNVKVIVPKTISDGIIVKENIGELKILKKIDSEKFTKAGDVVIKLSTPYDAAYITEEDAGLAVSSFCAIIRIKENIMNAKYLSAFLNTSYVREILKSKVMGSIRPMIKVNDLRNLEVPEIPEKKMNNIGDAYFLSGRKILLLQNMIETEKRIMESIVLSSIKEGLRDEKD